MHEGVIKMSYDQEFVDLMDKLRASLGDEIFELEGIGTQLDINTNAKRFLGASVTADVSVDSNANVDSKDVVGYQYELPTPLFKLNSMYLLWEKLKKMNGRQYADAIITAQMRGDIYINDFKDVGRPYSYHPHTVIHTDDGELTMEQLFADYRHLVRVLPDREEIHLQGENVKVFDGTKFIALTHILRHRSHTDLVMVETKRGAVSLVTEDHPFLTHVEPEGCDAGALCLDDEALHTNRVPSNLPKVEVRPSLAYLIGALAGDGHAGKSIGFTQKDIRESHFLPKFKKHFNVSVTGDKRLVIHGDYKLRQSIVEWVGCKAKNKHIPKFSLQMRKEARAALLAGVLDTDGTVNNITGVVDVCVTSFALVQQLASLAASLGFTRIRTSLVGKQTSKKSYKGKLQMYRCSFLITDVPLMATYSEKVKANQEILSKDKKRDGRWDSDKLHKLEKMPYKGEWVYDITTETQRFASNGLYCHNCFNYSCYDIVCEGLPMIKKIKSVAPKSLYAFKSQVEQFIVIASNSTLGATGIADVLICMAMYVQKMKFNEYRDGHIQLSGPEALRDYVDESIASLIYTLNQPMRGNQSPFTNVSLYDEVFLKDMVQGYAFVGEEPVSLETVKWVQEIYVSVMNREMRRTPITFPVTTACFAREDDGTIQDQDFVDFIAKESQEWGFINFYSGSSSTLSSCCRLRSDKDNEFFNSFGAGSSKIGSLGVVTLDLPLYAEISSNWIEFVDMCQVHVGMACHINNAKRSILKDRIDNGNMPLYTHGHMDLSKQYSTVGITGLYEAMEILGLSVTDDTQEVISFLKELNASIDAYAKKFNAPHNMEQVPGESSAVKLAKKDYIMGFNRDEYGLQRYAFYSNQFIPLAANVDMITRMHVQGQLDAHFSGGSIMHYQMYDRPQRWEDIKDLINHCAMNGVVYWALNYTLGECEAGHMVVGPSCPCGGNIIANYTRVVGFLTKTSQWNKTRREEDYPSRRSYKLGED